MLQPKLTSEPAYFDEYNQPCYRIDQEKGLSECQSNRLFEAAVADGYAAAVWTTLLLWVSRQVSLTAAGRKVDLLEIGGGTGAFFESVSDNAHTYINVEPGQIPLSGKELERLRDPRYTCIKCSAEDIPLEDDSVDVVLSIASFDHIPDYRKALGEIKRLLRKNGMFILTLNNRRSWWKLLLSKTDYLRRREEEIAKEHYFQWSFSQCRSSLSEFLTVSNMCTTTFIPFVPKAWKYALPVSDLLGKRLLRNYGANILAVCQKP